VSIQKEAVADTLRRGKEADSAPVTSGGLMPPILVLLRLHQWIKNLFVAAPLFFTPAALSPGAAGRVILGIACFSALASAMCVPNDWCDREADRCHPRKRLRPLAAGTVAAGRALLLALGLATAGSAFATLLLPAAFGQVLARYIVLNLAYSFWLKRIAILDVMVIGFVLRTYAGGFLIGVMPTVWIVACTLLLALFLALAKAPLGSLLLCRRAMFSAWVV
jgi:4-hydroxybenzoate polyprenyltransferase